MQSYIFFLYYYNNVIKNFHFITNFMLFRHFSYNLYIIIQQFFVTL